MDIQHTMCLRILKELGYDLVAIRQAMPHLTGIDHPTLAKITHRSRPYITLILSGIRTAAAVQKEIADAWGVPAKELFDDGTKTHGADRAGD